MLSDWKGYGPDILKQPGESTGIDSRMVQEGLCCAVANAVLAYSVEVWGLLLQ